MEGQEAACLQLRADTFFWHFQLAALRYLDHLCGFVARLLLHVLYRVHHIVALKNLAEHNMAAVEPGGDGSGDEELAAVGVWARVCHAEKALLAVFQLEVLVGKLVAVDGLSARTYSLVSWSILPVKKGSMPTVTPSKVSTLNHKVLNHSVEG